jgi:four helix bundle protein
VARELLEAVLACRIADPVLRDHALRSAKSTCLNIAEGAGRVSPREKARAFSIARGEAVEASAAVEIAAVCGEAHASAAREVARCADRLFALLTGLVR